MPAVEIQLTNQCGRVTGAKAAARTFSVALAGFLILLGGNAIGLVGFSYPRVVQDQPLHHPLKVLKVEGKRLTLLDGRCLDVTENDGKDLDSQLRQSGYLIDLEGERAAELRIYANQDGWVCGTPWAQPIRVPLWPQVVYRNRREIIGSAKLVAAP